MTSALPAPRYDHLRRLSDSIGLFEHARGAEPRRALGYCTDDVARALLLTSTADDAPADLHQLYLHFTTACVADDGSCHNRRAPTGQWTDAPSLGDWWGRAVWALATAVANQRAGSAAAAALALLVERRSPYRRSMGYAALGASLVAAELPSARRLLDDALARVARADPSGSVAPWPEPRLSYDNAVLPHALIIGGAAAGRDDLVAQGLAQLEFLVRAQQVAGHLSLVPAGGRDLADQPPGFDQQPIEACGLALAGASAFAVTGASAWLEVVGAAAGWFLGANDSATTMFDADTGAGYDGLTAAGRNLNRGAESTLAANLSLLLAHRRGVSACPPPFASTPTSASNPILTG